MILNNDQLFGLLQQSYPNKIVAIIEKQSTPLDKLSAVIVDNLNELSDHISSQFDGDMRYTRQLKLNLNDLEVAWVTRDIDYNIVDSVNIYFSTTDGDKLLDLYNLIKSTYPTIDYKFSDVHKISDGSEGRVYALRPSTCNK